MASLSRRKGRAQLRRTKRRRTKIAGKTGTRTAQMENFLLRAGLSRKEGQSLGETLQSGRMATSSGAIVQAMPDEEKAPQAKLQLAEEEEKAPQAKLQLAEEEEKAPQAKLQLAEDEEKAPQTKLQLAEDEEKAPQAKLQLAEEEEAQPMVQSKKKGTSDHFESRLKAQIGSGKALDVVTKQYLETKMEADFTGVRIHTGPVAEELTEEIGAQAFTYGNDIFFNQGKFNPQSEAGMHLLAHELTHTVQQGASPSVSND